jgi:hypothetical protein
MFKLGIKLYRMLIFFFVPYVPYVKFDYYCKKCNANILMYSHAWINRIILELWNLFFSEFIEHLACYSHWWIVSEINVRYNKILIFWLNLKGFLCEGCTCSKLIGDNFQTKCSRVLKDSKSRLALTFMLFNSNEFQYFGILYNYCLHLRWTS